MSIDTDSCSECAWADEAQAVSGAQGKVGVCCDDWAGGEGGKKGCSDGASSKKPERYM